MICTVLFKTMVQCLFFFANTVFSVVGRWGLVESIPWQNNDFDSVI
jgi:hypothetical protein